MIIIVILITIINSYTVISGSRGLWTVVGTLMHTALPDLTVLQTATRPY